MMTFPIEEVKGAWKGFVYDARHASPGFLAFKQTPFKFVVDVSLQDCKERLLSLRKERSFWERFADTGYSVVSVDVWPIARDTHEFLLIIDQRKHPNISIRGTLSPISANTSVLSGRIISSRGYCYGWNTAGIVVFAAFIGMSICANILPLSL